MDEGCHSSLMTSSTAHAEVIENPTPCDVLQCTSRPTSRLGSHHWTEDQDHDEEDDDQVVVGGCDEEDEHNDGGLSGALEMLPIPCTISCAPGVPAILLVNPPTEIVGATADGDNAGPAEAGSAGDSQPAPVKPPVHTRHHLTTSSTMKRLSVTRTNFYMRYLHPKSRGATQRERKATKTLAIVLGQYVSFCRLTVASAVIVISTQWFE